MDDNNAVPLATLELRSDYYTEEGDLRPKAREILIGENHLFFYTDPREHGGTAFWYYEWYSSRVGGGDEQVELRFHGWATALDGVRHLWFAEEGYIFYPDDELVQALAEVLKQCPCTY